ncbi:MAG TPA: hypothetical protein VHU88_12815 [Sporichthyaceae bacterium]|nr:hypothetical protein [Sporichthyaceae bacterium]
MSRGQASSAVSLEPAPLVAAGVSRAAAVRAAPVPLRLQQLPGPSCVAVFDEQLRPGSLEIPGC